MQGCGALIFSLTRLLNHSVKIGHIPIYIGIEWDFIWCELMIRRIISFHNNLRRKYWWVMNCSFFHKDLQFKYWWFTNSFILQHPFVNAKNKPLKFSIQEMIFLSKNGHKERCVLFSLLFFYKIHLNSISNTFGWLFTHVTEKFKGYRALMSIFYSKFPFY